MSIDFSKITPCGGNCTDCKYFVDGECKGCLSTKGKCIKMWGNRCEIFACCEKHNAKFCGLCPNFPCDLLENTITQWDEQGIQNLHKLKEEYEKETT